MSMSFETSKQLRGPRIGALAQNVIFAGLFVATALSSVAVKRFAPLTATPPLAGVTTISGGAVDAVELGDGAGEPLESTVAAGGAAVVVASAVVSDGGGAVGRGLRVDDFAASDVVTPAVGAIRYFDGRPLRVKKVMWMEVTAYSPDEHSCGKWADGITASNTSVWTNGMRLVAADTSLLPFGSLLSVPTYAGGDVVPVLDRGGAIKGRRLDVLYATHERAMKFGRQRLPVTIWEYADEG